MKKNVLFLTCVAVCFVWVNSVSALEITLDKSVPSSYAKLAIKKNDQGEKVTKTVFSKVSTAYTGCELNKIISAYAVSLDNHNVKNVPSSYAKLVTKKNDQGEKVTKAEFSKVSTAYTGRELNKIISAYAVSLDNDNVKNVPSSYAKLVTKKNDQGEKVTKAVFGNVSTAYTGSEFNKIISAYK